MKLIVAHIITGLTRGGAEMALFNFVSQLRGDPTVANYVLCLTGRTELSDSISDLGVSVIHFDINRDIFGLLRLFKTLKVIKPEIVHTWMYHSDLIGGVIAKLAGVRNIVWSLHNSSPGDFRMFSGARLASFLSSLFSWWLPKVIVAPSDATASAHINHGYCSCKLIVIALGVDFSKFNYDLRLREELRSKYNISDQSIVVGMIARYHVQKNFPLFLEIARNLRTKRDDFIFILAGPNVTRDNHDLVNSIDKHDLSAHVLLLGEVNGANSILSAFDIYLSTSMGESFSLILLEALVTGIPCVAHTTADPLSLIDGLGVTVAASDATAYSDAVILCLKAEIGRSSTLRKVKFGQLENKYSLSAMTDKYLSLYRKLKCH